LGLFHRAGYRVIVVSNQAGIARGAMTEADLAAINLRMTTEAREAGGRIDAVYHCPHDWDAGCECRKPRPGMLFQAQRDFSLDLTRTTFIGDDERDGEAADAAGCPFIRVSDRHSLHEAALALLGGPRADDTGIPLDLRRPSGQPA
jgi:D-glycero-D-manno-heptose 1,7-bisphosphate phosphatase